MPSNINLLPQSGNVSTSILKASGRLVKATVVLFVAFLVFGSLGAVFLVVTNTELADKIAENDSYKANIKSLQEAEQNLVLVRDRVGKVKTIINQRDFEEKLAKIRTLIASLPVEAKPEALEINVAKSTIKLVFESSQELSVFIKFLVASSDYQLVNLNTLEFKGSGNIDLELELV
ncbi:MAG: hypothetical protein ACD_52C00102G0004 [uncultured bacterium]|nr:MAG: hypothetical protein ACD_52C00102G0004 [uncultured bacterium]